MEHIQELKNAVDFLIRDIQSRVPKTMSEIRNNLLVWEQYEKILDNLVQREKSIK